MKKFLIFLAAAFLAAGLQGGLASGAQEPQAESEGYIVKLKEVGAGEVRRMSALEASPISTEAGLYRVESLEDVRQLEDSLVYYEPDYLMSLLFLPNDTHYSKQWSLNMLGAERLWDEGFDGTGVKIAVIDSGVNSMHEDFDGTSFERGKNMLNGSYDVTDISNEGHGTFISGILGAVKNNQKGIAGLLDGASIVPFKCFEAGPTTNSSYIIAAIYEAVDVFGCDVINLSLGMDMHTTSLKEAVEYASRQGVIVVSAVGNEGSTKLIYPAAYDCVVGVGAVDQNGTAAWFSQRNSSVYVTAPGVNIVSLSNTGNSAYAGVGGNKAGQGTSYAAPYVSAAAAVLKQYRSSANVEDFMAILRQSATDAGASGYDTSYGYGILNLGDFAAEMKRYYEEELIRRFTDISGHWAEPSIHFCVEAGLFKGTTETTFEPESVMNRAMFVTVLSRLSGEDTSGYLNPFSDVPEGSWYAQACAWAQARGLAEGTGAGAFSPLTSVTREQMAVLLYRYAAVFGLSDGSDNDSVLLGFSDRGQISPWAREALAWAVENGLITGRAGNSLAPGAEAKRSEVSEIIRRFSSSLAA